MGGVDPRTTLAAKDGYVNRRPFAKLSIHIFAEPEAKRKTISPTEAPAPIGFILINYI